jgi:hypothetical protein
MSAGAGITRAVSSVTPAAPCTIRSAGGPANTSQGWRGTNKTLIDQAASNKHRR